MFWRHVSWERQPLHLKLLLWDEPNVIRDNILLKDVLGNMKASHPCRVCECGQLTFLH